MKFELVVPLIKDIYACWCIAHRIYNKEPDVTR